jgi:hypothetical protein
LEKSYCKIKCAINDKTIFLKKIPALWKSLNALHKVKFKGGPFKEKEIVFVLGEELIGSIDQIGPLIFG